MSRAMRRLRRQRSWDARVRRALGPTATSVARVAARTAAQAAAGVGGAQLGLVLAGRTTRWVGPVRVLARGDLARTGGTGIELPPAGSATLRTHRGPLRVQMAAVDVDAQRVEKLLESTHDVREILAGAGGDARRLARRLAVRIAAAGVGGAAITSAVTLHRGRDVAAGSAIGAATVLGAAAAAIATRDPDAWRDPQLDGLLAKAPLILGDLRAAPQRLNTYRDQLAELLRTGTDVHRRILDLPDAPPADAIRLLHVSDVHLNPASHALMRALVEAYRVDAVVDTGDLVDWGTPAEEAFAARIGELGVPYVFVKGNHDSAGIARAVAAQPNATVLDAGDEPVEIAGLRFAGMADPRFTPDKTTGDDHAEHRVSERAAEFAATLDGRGAAPVVDVLLVHDPAGARALAGRAPLVLAGHTHRRSARRLGDTVVLTQGSSGGSGLRGVQHDPPTPLALSVVHLDRATKRLWGVDEVTLGGLGSVRLAVERRPAADLLGEHIGAPVEAAT